MSDNKMDRSGPTSTILTFRKDVSNEKKLDIIHKVSVSSAAFGIKTLKQINISENIILITTLTNRFISIERNIIVATNCTSILDKMGILINAKEILKAIAKDGFRIISRFEPPYLMIVGAANEASFITDPCGMVHAFHIRTPVCAAVSTSATLLAKTFGCPHDFYGVYQQMTVGHRLADMTAFSGIAMVPVATRARLSNGDLNFHRHTSSPVAAVNASLNGGVHAVSGAVGRCLRALPECGIELSGGLDSRMVLAAIPKKLRIDRPAYTIGFPGNPDIRIAAKLAERCGLQHQVINLEAFSNEAPERTRERLRRIAYRDDFNTNVVDRYMIDCVDDILLTFPRIGGINGELARGFYYPMLPVTRNPTESAIRKFIDWRLAINDSAPRKLFSQADDLRGKQHIFKLMLELLMHESECLGARLDEFYLMQRMRNWGGAAVSRACTSRMILAPFLHSDYVNWAMRCPVDAKRNSKIFSTVLKCLDAELSSIDLDSGMTPDDMSVNTILSQFKTYKAKIEKFYAKAKQKLGIYKKESIVIRQLSNNIFNNEVLNFINWEKLNNIGFLEARGLNALRLRELAWDRTSIGNMLSLHYQLEYLGMSEGDISYDVELVELGAGDDAI